MALNPVFGDPRMPARFWNNLVEDPVTGCWTWQGKPDADGYPNRTSTVNYTTKERPYRWSYRVLIGPIPLETLNHRCLNKMCCRPIPSHAGDPMTFVENVQDAKARTVVCPKGHRYDFENTRVRKQSGGKAGQRRECKQCSRDAMAAKRAADPDAARAAWTKENARRAALKRANPAAKAEKPPRTRCANGHGWNDVNIGGPPSKEYCRVCMRDKARARRQGAAV